MPSRLRELQLHLERKRLAWAASRTEREHEEHRKRPRITKDRKRHPNRLLFKAGFEAYISAALVIGFAASLALYILT